LVKSLGNQSPKEVLVPVVSCLFAPIEISLELDEKAWVMIMRVVKLHKLLPVATVIPTLRYLHINEVVQFGLRECLYMIDLMGCQAKHGG